jgi:translation initiation factor IF-1
MAKDDAIVLEGVVTDARRDSTFVVEVVTGEKTHQVLAKLAGKLRQNFIRILTGDKVRIEISPYDLGKGRITRRL